MRERLSREAQIDRFALSRERIRGGEIRHEMALKEDGRVGVSLNDFYAIGCEMERLRRQVVSQQNIIDNVRKAVEE